MNLLRKSVISFAGVTAAALLLAVASPRTVHALGEQLVSIANTATHPAVVEDVPHFASHIVTLFGSFDGGEHNYPYFSQVGPDANEVSADFLVPAGQSLVITGVEILPYTNAPAWSNSTTLMPVPTTTTITGPCRVLFRPSFNFLLELWWGAGPTWQ